jgi:hypothetical protein
VGAGGHRDRRRDECGRGGGDVRTCDDAPGKPRTRMEDPSRGWRCRLSSRSACALPTRHTLWTTRNILSHMRPAQACPLNLISSTHRFARSHSHHSASPLLRFSASPLLRFSASQHPHPRARAPWPLSASTRTLSSLSSSVGPSHALWPPGKQQTQPREP